MLNNINGENISIERSKKILEDSTLKLKKTLPRIIIPKEKNDMFLNWYNKDLRFQDNIPQVFNKGYVFIDNSFYNIDFENEGVKNRIKKISKMMSAELNQVVTYRFVENTMKKLIEDSKETVVYFEFEDNELSLNLYCKNKAISLLVIKTNETKEGANPSTEEIINAAETNQTDDISMVTYPYIQLCFFLIQSAFWYIATTTTTTKYKRTNKQPAYIYEQKTIINPKRNKTISTPFYDMRKIRVVTLDGLVKRRKGWTYSHSFEVRGHYRHYSDGKTIFVKSFIKGKDKKQASQTIILNPKEEK